MLFLVCLFEIRAEKTDIFKESKSCALLKFKSFCFKMVIFSISFLAYRNRFVVLDLSN